MAKCKKCPPPGLPAWLATFADLMSLLMCFFVLLLSFAQMDVVKFKAVAGSMQDAFGKDMISEVPGSLDKAGDKDYQVEAEAENPAPKNGEQSLQQQQIKADLAKLKDALEEEVRSGIVTIEDGGGRISVRVEQVQAFPSGQATLLKDFQPVLDKISDVLVDSEANVHVDGHTDNVPISSGRFRNNWELSAARAASVATELMRDNDIAPERMEIRGHADAQPLVDNDTPDNRARNRRIEIVLDYDRNPDAGGDGEAVDDSEGDDGEADPEQSDA